MMLFMRYQGMVYLFRSLVGSFCYDKGCGFGKVDFCCEVWWRKKNPKKIQRVC